MNVLITGSTGFIGQAVSKKLDTLGIHWTSFNGDVKKYDDYLKYKDCDILLHLAGINRTGPSYEEKKKLIDVNVMGTFNAIHFAQKNNMRFLFASTCSYDRTAKIPTPENEPMTYYDPYSYSKWKSEQDIFAWHKFFGLEGVIFRIFNVYGPNQPNGFLIPDILNKIEKGRLRLFNLTSIRDFIYITDLAELITCSIINTCGGLKVVNAGSGVGRSVMQVINTIFDLLGERTTIEDQNTPSHIPISIANVDYSKKLLNWTHKTSFEEGIRRVISSFNLKG